MSSTVKYTLLILLILLLGSIPLAMQRDSAVLEGRITNNQGVAIAGAVVEARNTMTGAVFRATADALGNYTIEDLPQGRYSLWVTAAAHDSVWIREVIVDRGSTTQRDIRLAISESPAPTGEAQ